MSYWCIGYIEKIGGGHHRHYEFFIWTLRRLNYRAARATLLTASYMDPWYPSEGYEPPLHSNQPRFTLNHHGKFELYSPPSGLSSISRSPSSLLPLANQQSYILTLGIAILGMNDRACLKKISYHRSLLGTSNTKQGLRISLMLRGEIFRCAYLYE